MFRKLYFLMFGGLPKYLVVKYRDDYFPMKKNVTGYPYMYDDRLGSHGWTSESNKKISLGFPGLHGCRSLKRSKHIIEDLDGVEIKPVDWDPPRYFMDLDIENHYYFDPIKDKSFVKKPSGETTKGERHSITA